MMKYEDCLNIYFTISFMQNATVYYPPIYIICVTCISICKFLLAR